jgi:hypothetical protein
MTPASQSGVIARYQIRIAGGVVRIIRTVSTGVLEPIDIGPYGCSLVLNQQGFLSVLACNTVDKPTQPATYGIITSCSTSDYVLSSDQASQTVTVAPQACQRVNVEIVLAGANISPVLRNCTVKMYVENSPDPISELGVGCHEEEANFLGALGQFLTAAPQLEGCSGGAWSESSCILRVVIIIVIIAASAFVLLYLLRGCTKCGAARK